MEMIQKETFNHWFIETNKPDLQKDKNLTLKLVAELRSNNQQLSLLGMVTPIIATIKNIIDDKKDKKIIIRYISKFNNYEYNESTVIDEEDYNPNRKFWMNYN